MSDSKPVYVGSIWNKTSKNTGNEYLSVSLNVAELLKSLGFEPPEGVEKVNLSAFKNTKKVEEKQPDYRLTYFLE